MRISDWSSDVCSSDLGAGGQGELMGDVAVVDCDQHPLAGAGAFGDLEIGMRIGDDRPHLRVGEQRGREFRHRVGLEPGADISDAAAPDLAGHDRRLAVEPRSEEHTSEIQSLMRIWYAVFGMKNKRPHLDTHTEHTHKL